MAPGAPTVNGEFRTGAGNIITLVFTVTPDWPGDKKTAIGSSFENGKFEDIKFGPVELEIAKGFTYQTLEKANYFTIIEEKTDDSDVTAVNLLTGAPGTELKHVGAFIVKPSIGVQTLHPGRLQWLLQDGTTV